MSRLPEVQDPHWEMIFSTTLLYRAEIIKGLLEEEGIQCVIVNKQDSSYIAFGEIELFVPREDVLTAKKIMEGNVSDE